MELLPNRTNLNDLKVRWTNSNDLIDLTNYLEEIYKHTLGNEDYFISHLTDIAKKENDDSLLLCILNDKNQKYEVRFMSFYILCVKYRRFKEFSKFKQILLKNKALFLNEQLFWFQNATYKKVTLKAKLNFRSTSYVGKYRR